MTPEQIHLERLRNLQKRYDCAENVGNEDGCRMIQGLIDSENERWQMQQMLAVPDQNKKESHE